MTFSASTPACSFAHDRGWVRVAHLQEERSVAGFADRTDDETHGMREGQYSPGHGLDPYCEVRPPTTASEPFLVWFTR